MTNLSPELQKKCQKMADEYINKTQWVFDSDGVPVEEVYEEAFKAGVEAERARAKKWCPCGDVILADTEDWPVPMCHDCSLPFASLIEALEFVVIHLKSTTTRTPIWQVCKEALKEFRDGCSKKGEKRSE